MLAPVRALKSTASIGLVVALGFVMLVNPLLGVVSLIGALLAAIVKWNESSVPQTKRRSLANVWSMFGGSAVLMGVLCGLTIVASLLLAHPAFVGPVVFFTLAACWLPLIGQLVNRKR